jgi:hypothetical protein
MSRYLKSAGVELYGRIASMKPSRRRGSLAVGFAAYVIELENIVRETSPRQFAVLRKRAWKMIREAVP